MTTSPEIRRSLGHPVIDIDGHMAEHLPTLAPYLEQEGLSLEHPSFRRLVPPYGGTDRSWHEQTVQGITIGGERRQVAVRAALEFGRAPTGQKR